MKINLTKDEWEFLKRSNEWFFKEHHTGFFDMKEDLIPLESLLEKLGSKWVDDE